MLVLLAVLKIVHLNFMATSYSAADYSDDGLSVDQMVVGVLVALVVALAIPMRLRSASDLLLWMMAALVVLPTAVVVLSNSLYESVRGTALAVALGGLVLLSVVLRIPASRPLLGGTRDARYSVLLISIVAILAPILAIAGGIRTLNLDLSQAYDIRTEYKGSGLGLVTQYGVAWLGTVLVPLLLVWSLRRRNVLGVLVALAATVLDYSLTGYRLVLLGPLLVGAVYFLAKLAPRLGRYAAAATLSAISGLVVVSWLALPVSLQGVLLERTIFLPGKITAEYSLYYSSLSPHTHWSYGILNGVFGPPAIEPGMAIGREYYLFQTNANANSLADGFAAFDLFGVAIAVALLGGLMWLYRAASFDRDPVFTIPAFTMTALYLTNVGVLTQSLNGGLLFLIFMVAISPRLSKPRVTSPASPDAPSGANALETRNLAS